MMKICVIGSMNIDLTIRLPRFHAPGETIIGNAFNTYAGGKGGNQAVAVAALGSKVLMVGKLGDDDNGVFYLKEMRRRGVDISCVETFADMSSGVALIEVDQVGENRIAIVPGTNALVDRRQIDRILPKLLEYDIFMFQLEIPLDTVCYAAKMLHAHGKNVILDPAPALPLPDSLYKDIDYLTPNMIELSMLSNHPVTSEDEIESACNVLVEKGVRAIIAKLGHKGCLYVDADKTIRSNGYTVDVVDTTAAGDSFNAALAVALANGWDMRKTLSFANAAGALSTMGAGAQQAMPSFEQVMELFE